MVYLSLLSPPLSPRLSPVGPPITTCSSSPCWHQPLTIFNHRQFHSPIHFNFTLNKPLSSSFPCNCSNEQQLSHDSDDDDEDGQGVVEYVADTANTWNSRLPDRWDVLGLGQAMVDFSGMVDDEFLERLGIEKGTRKLVNHEERGRVLRAMDGCSYKAAAGGSLSNSLVALARLGGQPIGGPPLNVAMAGSVGSDPLGGFYRTKLRRANVNFLSEAVKDGTTGTVIVLTTPDAQRTMLAYQMV